MMDKKTRLIEIDRLAEEAYKKLVSRSRFYLQKIAKKLHKGVVSKEKKLTDTLAMLLLNQNIVTVRIIKQLILKNQYDEVSMLMRAVIERSALVYRSLEKNLCVEEIEKLKATDCIKYLKNHFDIGRLYGFFSKIIHSEPLSVIHFAILKFYTDGKKAKTEKAYDLETLFKILLIFILEVNFAVIKFIVKDYIKANSHWKLKNNLWVYLPISKSKFKSIYDGLITLYYLYDKAKNKLKEP